MTDVVLVASLLARLALIALFAGIALRLFIYGRL